MIGAGHTRFGALREGPRELLRNAVDQAFASVDKGIDRTSVEEAYLGSLGAVA